MTRSLFVAGAVLVAAVAATEDVPFLTGRVVDDAHLLSDRARATLTSTLQAHEDATTNQIVVLTLPTLGGGDIESFANNVFHTWKLGQKGKDNGVLVLVVPNDRKVRIEVGYGLEPTLPDGAAGEIIRTWMTPAFKAGNYDKGIEDGVAAIIARLEGRPPEGLTPIAPPPTRVSSNGFDRVKMPWPQLILMSAFIFGIVGLFTVIGVMTPGIGWFLYFFLIPFWSMFPMALIGARPTTMLLGAYLIGYPVAKLMVRKKEWYLKAQRELKTSGSTSFGGFIVSSGGSSSSGGSDFSGGGGESGGGGASGSW